MLAYSVRALPDVLCSRIGRAEENENRWWYVLMLVCSVVFYVGSLVGIILLYVFFTEVSKWFIGYARFRTCRVLQDLLRYLGFSV